MKIAFLGMGIMGSPMAINLAGAGHSVVIFNRTPVKPEVKLAEAASCRLCLSPAAAAQGASIIFSCVDNAEVLNRLYFGPDGVLETAKTGAALVDFSTIGARAAVDLHASLMNHSLRFLDAPVSGGQQGAVNGTLTIMVGGDEAVFREVASVLSAVGDHIAYCGPAGSGQAVKGINQYLCAANLLSVKYALAMADQLGLDPSDVVSVCSKGAANSWQLEHLGRSIIELDNTPGFKLRHMLKDLRLAKMSLSDEANEMSRVFGIYENSSHLGELGTQAILFPIEELPKRKWPPS